MLSDSPHLIFVVFRVTMNRWLSTKKDVFTVVLSFLNAPYNRHWKVHDRSNGCNEELNISLTVLMGYMFLIYLRLTKQD